MKMRFVFGLILLHAAALQAQNLVINPGFETGPCPSTYSQINMVPNWYSPTNGTPDHFNTCATGANVAIPDNGVGWQNPHSGQAYAGIVCYVIAGVFWEAGMIDSNGREYIQTKLASPLVPGKTYKVSYYVSLADGKINQHNINYATDDIGACFSVNPLVRFSPWSGSPLRLIRTPQVRNPEGNFLTSTENWTLISGCFTADSAYGYLTIGCFEGGGISLQQVGTLVTGMDMIYYYIDDIAVEEQPDPGDILEGDPVLCNGRPVLLNAATGTNFQWSTGENTASIEVSDPGMYHLTIASGGCPYTDSVEVIAVTLAPDLGENIFHCDLKTLVLDGSSGNPLTQYLWSTGETSPSISVTGTGPYWIEQSVGNCTARDSVEVELVFSPELDLGADNALCELEIRVLESGLDPEKNQLLWSTGEKTADITVQEPGIYWVTASNLCGTAEDWMELTDGGDCNCPVFVPNAFTPGGNHLNEAFGPAADCSFSEFRFEVFNRWGESIFSTGDPAIHWQGTDAAYGVYSWRLTYTLQQPTLYKHHEKWGMVTLIR